MKVRNSIKQKQVVYSEHLHSYVLLNLFDTNDTLEKRLLNNSKALYHHQGYLPAIEAVNNLHTIASSIGFVEFIG
jgi:hypothetical protein